MINLLLRDDLDTLLTGDRDIDFNPCRDIEELEHLLANEFIPFPRESEDSISSLNPSCDSSFTAVTDTLIDSDSYLGLDLGLSEIVAPLPSIKKTDIRLREVERFDPFFSLAQSGEETRVVETPSFGFHHIPSPRPAVYSPKEIPSGESKVHIEVLSVLWGNRLPIPDGSLPLSSDDLECSMPIDTPPSPYLVVLGDEMIDLLLRDDLDTLSTGDRDIDFNPCRDIEELEHLLANEFIPFPRESEDSINSGFYLRFDLRLSEIVSPLPSIKKTDIRLREVKRFDPFFSLAQSGEETRVVETLSFGFHHIPSPRPAVYSPKEVMYHYYHPHLTTGDEFDHGPRVK
ncbi:hypothetical protein Tco_0527820 [Tanacetum coccineum]